MDKIKLSIAIPIYNGAKTIEDALDSILPQITDSIEIVISDNASTDNTQGVIKEFRKKSSNVIQYYCNENNLGADKNFDLAVKRAKGEFVWILSANDIIIRKNAVKEILAKINLYPDLALIYLNYKNENLGKLIEQDHLCNNGSDFFEYSFFKNGLISSNIVNRSLWGGLNLTKYYGTGWIQLGYTIEALSKHKSYIFHELFIEQNKKDTKPTWGNKGTFLYTGLELFKTIASMKDYNYNNKLIKKLQKQLIRNFYITIPYAKAKGLKFSRKLFISFYQLYKKEFFFWLLYLPLMLIPSIFYQLIYNLYKKIKNG